MLKARLGLSAQLTHVTCDMSYCTLQNLSHVYNGAEHVHTAALLCRVPSVLRPGQSFSRGFLFNEETMERAWHTMNNVSMEGANKVAVCFLLFAVSAIEIKLQPSAHCRDILL